MPLICQYSPSRLGFERVTYSPMHELWLPMHRRIAFKILMLMRNCLAGQAPIYLRELCVPVSSLLGRRSLRSAEQGDLVVPRVRLATAQRRSFCGGIRLDSKGHAHTDGNPSALRL